MNILIILTYLVFSLGVSLGAVGATFAQIFFLYAVKDGVIDEKDRAFLGIVYRVIRVGMTLMTIAGVAMGLLWYYLWNISGGNMGFIESVPPAVWAFTVMFASILANRLLIQKKIAPMWLTTGWLLASWYGIFLLWSFPSTITLELWALVGLYLIGIAVACGLLKAVRSRFGVVLQQ